MFSGHSKSCGCIRRKTHGKSHTKFYQQYYGMIKRCELKTHKEYKDYGGRGIKVCDEWRSNFQSFYDWSMSNGYEGSSPLKEWSKQEDIFIPYGTILRRYHCGWSAKDILFKETRK